MWEFTFPDTAKGSLAAGQDHPVELGLKLHLSEGRAHAHLIAPSCDHSTCHHSERWGPRGQLEASKLSGAVTLGSWWFLLGYKVKARTGSFKLLLLPGVQRQHLGAKIQWREIPALRTSASCGLPVNTCPLARIPSGMPSTQVFLLVP